MIFATLDVYNDYVQIDKHTLERPSGVAVSQWVEFWENAKAGETWQEGFEAGQKEAKSEIDGLEDEVSALEAENERLEAELKVLEREIGDLENEVAVHEEQLDKEYERGRADGIIEGRLDSSL